MTVAMPSQDLPGASTAKPVKTRLRKPWSYGRAYAPTAVILLLVVGSLVWLSLYELTRSKEKRSAVEADDASLP